MFEIAGGSFVGLLTEVGSWEVFVQQMVFVVDHFAEELFVGCFEQILEQWNVTGTESAAAEL